MTNSHKLILRMVQTGSVANWTHIVKPEFFAEYYLEVYKALILYETQFKKCMSPQTFQTQWPDFDWVDLTEDVEWYADEVEADFLANKIKTAAEEALEAADADPKTVLKLLQTQINELQPYVGKTLTTGVDLFEHQLERAKIINTRRVETGLSGITSGFDLIDEHSFGTQRKEIELLVARPGEGKSLLLLYGAYRAVVDQGKRVSFISPEMTAYEMGLRLDSMHHHLSSMHIQSGRMTEDEVADYLDLSLDGVRGIRFYEPFARGRFTTADVASIIRNDAPDILMIDGLMLVDPVGNFRDIRTRLITLMEELKEQVMESGCPIRAAHQSNRNPETQTSKRQREQSPLTSLPELHHLAESGSTEQYANRVLTFKYLAPEKRMYVALRKNRNAPSGRIFSFIYDIDKGNLSQFKLEGSEAEESSSSEGESPELFDESEMERLM